jgi:hypothetical protein
MTIARLERNVNQMSALNGTVRHGGTDDAGEKDLQILVNGLGAGKRCPIWPDAGIFWRQSFRLSTIWA